MGTGERRAILHPRATAARASRATDSSDRIARPAGVARGQVSSKYQMIGLGACRGNGGTADHVNSKWVAGGVHSEASCEAECDAEPDCKGFAWGAMAGGSCFVYGPNLAGHCHLEDTTNGVHAAFVAEQDTEEKCSAAGGCSDTSVVCGDNCLGLAAVCANLDATWTSMGATWVGPEDPWMHVSTSTTHIHDANGNADFSCYDLDLDDHAATCTNEPTAHSGHFQCADEWTSPSDGGTCGSAQYGCPAAPCNDGVDTVSWCCNEGSADCSEWHYCACERDFEAADTFAEEDCDVAGGCVYAAAPRMEREVVPHPPSTMPHGSDGRYHFGQSGACRGEDENGAQVGANSKYSNSCDIDGKLKACGGDGQEACSMTQEECEAGCAAENAANPGACNAYHHGAWCSVFGPNVHAGVGIDDENPCWFANVYDATMVTGTNTNAGYLCWMACGIDGRDDGDQCPAHEGDHDGGDHGGDNVVVYESDGAAAARAAALTSALAAGAAALL